MQGSSQDTIGRAPTAPRHLSVDALHARPVPARLISARLIATRLFAASLLSASLLAASFVSPSLAGPTPAQPPGTWLEHPPPPVRVAALLPREIGNRGLGDPSAGRALRGRGMQEGGASPLPSSLFASVRSNDRNVFGSVALGMSGIAASDQWRRVLAEDAGRFFRDGCGSTGAGPCNAPHWPRWTALHDRAATLPARERIAFVNREVNRLVRYREDEALYGRRDHWATLTETVRAGAGDCEDYAIAKMWLLEALGVPLSSMQLVALRDERRGLEHAVLAVHLHDQILLLDNVHDRVLPDAAVGHYRPMFSFVGEQGFVHGFRRPAEQLAAATP